MLAAASIFCFVFEDNDDEQKNQDAQPEVRLTELHTSFAWLSSIILIIIFISIVNLRIILLNEIISIVIKWANLYGRITLIVLIVLVIPVRLLANTVQVFVHALQHDLKVVEEVENTARVNCDLCYLTWIGAFYKIFEDIRKYANRKCYGIFYLA